MAGMKFLNLKGWHPSNARNQKRIWIAEQKAKAQELREQEAAAEVRKNAELQRFQELAAARGDDDDGARRRAQQAVGFLYAPPPGLQKVDEAAAQDMTEDDAVREFRRKMEKKTKTGSNGGDGPNGAPEDTQRALERYVGRRPDEPLTIKEQVERFPFLKDAPVEGDYAASVKVNFKPMGVQLRNVRCLRCGEWGHQSGDRECSLRNFNPHDAARQAREDPMAYMAQLNQQKKQELVLKRAALPLEMQGDASGAKQSEYEILLSDDDADSSDPEREFLAKLSSREKRLLLKKLRKQTRANASESSSDSSSSSSNSSEDDSDAGTHRKKHRRKRHRHHRKAKAKKKKSKGRGRSHDRSPSPRRYQERHRQRDEDDKPGTIGASSIQDRSTNHIKSDRLSEAGHRQRHVSRSRSRSPMRRHEHRSTGYSSRDEREHRRSRSRRRHHSHHGTRHRS